MQPDDDLHVLAHRPHALTDVLFGQPMSQEWREVPTSPDHRFLLEHRKDPAQNQNGVHPVEAGTGRGKRAEIFDHLKAWE
jgi:hypothetical protein